jgi:glycosyltransferase involved in cell wall biosynthesis
MIGGPGANRALYEAIAERAARLPNVQFKGFLPLHETERWFDRARVLVNTSDYEGMPNTFLQAWARGVPTVATVDVGSPVHRVASTVDELAENIEAAFGDPGLGERCRQYFHRTHSSVEVLKRYAQVFSELVQ